MQRSMITTQCTSVGVKQPTFPDVTFFPFLFALEVPNLMGLFFFYIIKVISFYPKQTLKSIYNFLNCSFKVFQLAMKIAKEVGTNRFVGSAPTYSVVALWATRV